MVGLGLWCVKKLREVGTLTMRESRSCWLCLNMNMNMNMKSARGARH